jgi:glucosamine 6-phosphate synthetase-like amidotransferase/phosphosugar isomerase protein
MCGISGSIINLNPKTNNQYQFSKIFGLINNNSFYECYKEIKKLRCSNTYLKLGFYKDRSFISKIEKITSELNKKRDDKNFEIIDDIIWVISHELIEKNTNILKIINDNKLILSKQLILFLRNFLLEIENINYLETRGRDSASISFTIKLGKESNIDYPKKNNAETLSLNKIIKDKKEYINITLKISNRIGYTGENSNNLIKNLFKSNLLKKINFLNSKSVVFLTHTRWATVGEVNLSNCHPLISKNKKNIEYFSMNGDIINYNILKKKIPTHNNDLRCSNDLSILPDIFKNKKISTLKGSFVILHHSYENPSSVTIYKKGSQGLYISEDCDKNPILASDVYGLVNRSDKFNIIKDKATFKLENLFKNPKNLKFKDYKSSDLSTRDLNKKKFTSYFLKEVADTNLFIKRTIINTVDIKNKKIKNLDIFNSKTLKKLKSGKIKNFIFTGMGSCYTAAVGISKYLSNSLKQNHIYNVKVEATIASEGSGFYLKNNMSDTVIVVLAQSGTTIDTNIFAKMAKKRGAYTISIVNKKLGDVTYIVDKNLYLGNGRDVELSVPSTKTYTCHLIMGYIMVEQILSLINKNDKNFVNKIEKLFYSNFIESTIRKISHKIKAIKINPTNYKNWVVIYDSSFNAFTALEFRIKLSECCYRSIPYFSVEQFNQSKIDNCLVFYIGAKGQNILLQNNSLLMAISNFNIPKAKNKKLIKIQSKETISNTIESSIALQLMAHHVALNIDIISNKKNLYENKKIINYVYDQYDLVQLVNKSNNFINKQISERLKRPIDTIKHQAKTITVGALRAESKKMNIKNIHKNKDIDIHFNKDEFKYLFNDMKNNIYIESDTKNEINKYYLCNIIENCNKQYNTNKNFFFKDYELSNIHKESNNTLVSLGREKLNYKKDVVNLNNIDFYDILKLFLKPNNYSKINEIKYLKTIKFLNNNRKKYMLNLSNYFKQFNNIKFLGSGINYLSAKKHALLLSKKFNITIAYDVIENHKHIDISSEALLIIFASNIDRTGFQNDVLSEVEKFESHNNKVILFSNLGNDLFDGLNNKKKSKNFKKLIKFPYIDELYSPCFFDYYFNNFLT